MLDRSGSLAPLAADGAATSSMYTGKCVRMNPNSISRVVDTNASTRIPGLISRLASAASPVVCNPITAHFPSRNARLHCSTTDGTFMDTQSSLKNRWCVLQYAFHA